MTIQNFFTSRDNNISSNVYVGQVDRLWYDPVTNTIYVSDGVTPGGIPVGGGGANITYGNANVANYLLTNTGNIQAGNLTVLNTANLGNLTIYDQTIAGTIADRDITLVPLGNGGLDVLGGICSYPSGNISEPPVFEVADNGHVTVLIPTISADSGVDIVGSSSGATVEPQNIGVLLHLTGQDGIPSRIYNDSGSAYAAYIGRRYNATADAPTGVLNNQVISRIGATPYLLDGQWPTISTTRIDFVTTEDQYTTAQGSKILFYTVPNGGNVPTLLADFDVDAGIKLEGNVIPATDNDYDLGNSTHTWANVWVGPGGVYLEDPVLAVTSNIKASNGVFEINNVSAAQVGNIQLTTIGLSSTDPAQNIELGKSADTSYVEIQNIGIEFQDGTQQITAAIPLNFMANAFGVATLGGDGKVPASQLPAGAITFKGIWDAGNNSPTLADGIGNVGDEYIVGTAGTQDLGSGNITFAVGDFVLYTTGNVWVDVPVGSTGVASFNGRTGVVNLTSSDVTNALSNSSITNSKLVNSDITIVTGAGLSGGATVPLGGTITLTNDGVRAALAGTGVTVSAATGNVTFSIGQDVSPGSSVVFNAITSNTTIQAIGNITGGNLTTSGQVSAGNIITSGLTVTNQSNLGDVGNVHITGGSSDYVLVTDGTGNLSWSPNGQGNSQYYGAFYSSVTQPNAGITVANPISYDTTDFASGVSIVANTRITMQFAQIYNIQFSCQVDKTDAGTDYIDIWLSKNGTNVPYTNTRIDLTGNNAKAVAAWNFVVQANAGDYFELYWHSPDIDLRLFAQGAQINPLRPAIPSVILTVVQA